MQGSPGRRSPSEGSTPVTRPFPAIRHPRGVSHTECGFSSLSLTQSCMAKSLCIWFCAPGEVGSYLGLIGTCSARSGKARSMATCTGCCLARLISTWEGHHLTHTHTPIVILAKEHSKVRGVKCPSGINEAQPCPQIPPGIPRGPGVEVTEPGLCLKRLSSQNGMARLVDKA